MKVGKERRKRAETKLKIEARDGEDREIRLIAVRAKIAALRAKSSPGVGVGGLLSNPTLRHFWRGEGTHVAEKGSANCCLGSHIASLRVQSSIGLLKALELLTYTDQIVSSWCCKTNISQLRGDLLSASRVLQCRMCF